MSEFEKLISRYNDIKYRIKRVILQQEELRELGCIPKSFTEGMPSNIGNSNAEAYIIKLDELAIKQKELEKELDKLRNLILEFIDLVPNNTAREILECRIFTDISWKKISNKVNYCQRWVIKLFDESIDYIKMHEVKANEL